MIQPSAFRLSPADLPGPCRRTRCPAASYTTLGDTIWQLAVHTVHTEVKPIPVHAALPRQTRVQLAAPSDVTGRERRHFRVGEKLEKRRADSAKIQLNT